MADVNDESSNNANDDQVLLLKNCVASGSINFLFGAGVNGGCFPMMSGFETTLSFIKEYLDGDYGLEEAISLLDSAKKEEALQTFVDEFNSFTINRDNQGYRDLQDLFKVIYSIISKTQNRNDHTKKVNIFTLNYDGAVESVLDENSFFHHVVSANKGDKRAISDIIGFDVSKHVFVPTFIVSKIHGSVGPDGRISQGSVILPDLDKKLSSALSRGFFNVLFQMKSELNKRNAILFIIGYSGSDDDVNAILSESSGTGVTIFWLKHSDSDTGVDKLGLQNLITIQSNGQNSTRVLADLLSEAINYDNRENNKG